MKASQTAPQERDMTIGSQEMFKLPPKTERKADGIYRYRRRVPVKAIKALGKGFLYRNLGRTKDEVEQLGSGTRRSRSPV